MRRKKRNIKGEVSNISKMGDITQKWVNLIMPFTSGYGQRFTQSELSRASDIPQQTSSRYLDSLVKKGIVNYEVRGRNKLFYIDMQNQSSGALLQMIENYKALQFQQNVKEASVIINELLNHTESIILFGSYSSNKFTDDSDIDLVMVGKSDKARIKNAKQKFSVSINEQYISYKEFARLLKSKNPLAVEILKNHIIFGEVSKIVHVFMGAA